MLDGLTMVQIKPVLPRPLFSVRRPFAIDTHTHTRACNCRDNGVYTTQLRLMACTAIAAFAVCVSCTSTYNPPPLRFAFFLSFRADGGAWAGLCGTTTSLDE